MSRSRGLGKLPKVRNIHAVNAWNRKGGAFKDRKKAANNKACRGKVTP